MDGDNRLVKPGDSNRDYVEVVGGLVAGSRSSGFVNPL